MPKAEWLAPDDTVRVTEEDIKTAVAANQFNCAIVCAIQRRYPKAKRVRVNKDTIAFSIGEERFLYPTPPAAVESIIEPLDTGGKPEPGLVRLKGGLVREVEHKDDEWIANERLRRRGVIQDRITKHLDNAQGRSEYGRFDRRDNNNG